MADITQLKIGSTTYDLRDPSKVSKAGGDTIAGNLGIQGILGANSIITTGIECDSISGTSADSGKVIQWDPSGYCAYYFPKSSTSTFSSNNEILTWDSVINSSTKLTTLNITPVNPTLAYGTTTTIGYIGGQAFKVTMPAGSSSSFSYSSSSSDSNFPLIAKPATGSTSTSSAPVYTTQVYLNPKNGELSAASFYATSDKRLKENIKEYIPQKSILDLPIVEFDFKESGCHTIGCLAQDLQEICPEIVNTDSNGYLSINESKIIYLLLDEVKKLRKEVDMLKEGA